MDAMEIDYCPLLSVGRRRPNVALTTTEHRMSHAVRAARIAALDGSPLATEKIVRKGCNRLTLLDKVSADRDKDRQRRALGRRGFDPGPSERPSTYSHGTRPPDHMSVRRRQGGQLLQDIRKRQGREDTKSHLILRNIGLFEELCLLQAPVCVYLI